MRLGALFSYKNSCLGGWLLGWVADWRNRAMPHRTTRTGGFAMSKHVLRLSYRNSFARPKRTEQSKATSQGCFCACLKGSFGRASKKNPGNCRMASESYRRDSNHQPSLAVIHLPPKPDFGPLIRRTILGSSRGPCCQKDLPLQGIVC